MLNSMEDMKVLWNPENLGMSDIPDASGVSEYERFIKRICGKAGRRINKLIPSGSFNTESEALLSAEIEFAQVFVLEHLWMLKAAGSEKQIEMPGGFKISLQEFTSEDYEHLMTAHIYNAERELSDYE